MFCPSVMSSAVKICSVAVRAILSLCRIGIQMCCECRGMRGQSMLCRTAVSREILQPHATKGGFCHKVPYSGQCNRHALKQPFSSDVLQAGRLRIVSSGPQLPREQGVGGSNPLAPTIFPNKFHPMRPTFPRLAFSFAEGPVPIRS